MIMIPRKLNLTDRDLLLSHLLSLKGDDRRLRFGGIVNDNYIVEYVDKSFNTENNKWFGVEDDNRIVAACHAYVGEVDSELGCSVDPEYRNHGLAQSMFYRAVTWLRTQGVTDVFMHCLTENHAMKHIAKKNQMTVVSDSGETDASVKIIPPTPLTSMHDAYLDRIAIYDMVLKSQMSFFRKVTKSYK